MTRIGKVSKETFATLVDLVPILRDLWGGLHAGGILLSLSQKFRGAYDGSNRNRIS